MRVLQGLILVFVMLPSTLIASIPISTTSTSATRRESSSPAVIQAPGFSSLVVYVGYADDSRLNSSFPNPWKGSPKVVFLGGGSPLDAGAIRIDNTSNQSITVDAVSVLLHGPNSSIPYGHPPGPVNLWGNFSIPAGFSAILTQTTAYNFDTSDDPLSSCGNPVPLGSAPYPMVSITIAGQTVTLGDTAHILDTLGFDVGCQGSEAHDWATIGTPSLAPENLQATPGVNKVELTWHPPSMSGGSPIIGYNLYRGTSSGGESLLATLGNVTSYTDSPVLGGTTYYYVVTARNYAGESLYSNEATATPPSSPTAPRNLAAVRAVGRVILTWSAPASDGGSPITGYRVYRGTSPGTESLLATLGVQLSYNDTDVVPGTTYYYRVTASNVLGESPVSNEASAMVPSVYSAPQNLQATGGNNQIGLSWSAPSGNGGSPITGYKIYRGRAPGGESLLAAIGNLTSYTDNACIACTPYYYQVRANNALGDSPPSNEARATSRPPIGVVVFHVNSTNGGTISCERHTYSDGQNGTFTPFSYITCTAQPQAGLFFQSWRGLSDSFYDNPVIFNVRNGGCLTAFFASTPRVALSPGIVLLSALAIASVLSIRKARWSHPEKQRVTHTGVKVNRKPRIKSLPF